LVPISAATSQKHLDDRLCSADGHLGGYWLDWLLDAVNFSYTGASSAMTLVTTSMASFCWWCGRRFAMNPKGGLFFVIYNGRRVHKICLKDCSERDTVTARLREEMRSNG